ncbi:hypothetical protein BJY52DRAFT_1224263 [Lactarius psammicola]|nr:hypothetical protein BJY52DRAFT_1224263 [Lactarius psammicola]
MRVQTHIILTGPGPGNRLSGAIQDPILLVGASHRLAKRTLDSFLSDFQAADTTSGCRKDTLTAGASTKSLRHLMGNCCGRSAAPVDDIKPTSKKQISSQQPSGTRPTRESPRAPSYERPTTKTNVVDGGEKSRGPVESPVAEVPRPPSQQSGTKPACESPQVGRTPSYKQPIAHVDDREVTLQEQIPPSAVPVPAISRPPSHQGGINPPRESPQVGRASSHKRLTLNVDDREVTLQEQIPVVLSVPAVSRLPSQQSDTKPERESPQVGRASSYKRPTLNVDDREVTLQEQVPPSAPQVQAMSRLPSQQSGTNRAPQVGGASPYERPTANMDDRGTTLQEPVPRVVPPVPVVSRLPSQQSGTKPARVSPQVGRASSYKRPRANEDDREETLQEQVPPPSLPVPEMSRLSSQQSGTNRAPQVRGAPSYERPTVNVDDKEVKLQEQIPPAVPPVPAISRLPSRQSGTKPAREAPQVGRGSSYKRPTANEDDREETLQEPIPPLASPVPAMSRHSSQQNGTNRAPQVGGAPSYERPTVESAPQKVQPMKNGDGPPSSYKRSWAKLPVATVEPALQKGQPMNGGDWPRLPSQKSWAKSPVAMVDSAPQNEQPMKDGDWPPLPSQGSRTKSPVAPNGRSPSSTMSAARYIYLTTRLRKGIYPSRLALTIYVYISVRVRIRASVSTLFPMSFLSIISTLTLGRTLLLATLAKHFKFRILVIGRSGSGKSSHIKAVFKVDVTRVRREKPVSTASFVQKTVTGHGRAACLIGPWPNRAMAQPDSAGSPGDSQDLQTIRDFVSYRTDASRSPPERLLHAVWIYVPASDAIAGRLGDGVEEIPGLRNVPVVVVFTKFDVVVSQVRLDSPSGEPQRHEPARARAHIMLITDSRAPSARSSRQGAKQQAGAVPLAWSAALRVNHESSFKLPSRYWRSLLSSLDFADQTLKNCVNIIHVDIVEIWNMDNKTKVRDVYGGSQENVCCVMGYIVDLTAILGGIFRMAAGDMSPNHAQQVFERHARSQHGDAIHRDIRSFITEAFPMRHSMPQTQKKDLVLEHVIDLIKQFCVPPSGDGGNS